MAAMKRRQMGFLVLGGVLVMAGIVGWHIHGLLLSGQPVFWLQELWAPSGLLSVGLVSGLDFLMPPPPGPSQAPKNPRKAPRSRRP
jgi:hypothetical protein